MGYDNDEECVELKPGQNKVRTTLENNNKEQITHNTGINQTKSMKPFWNDVKLVLYGHVCWICGFGVTRSLTVAYPALKSNFGGSDSIVGLFTTMILLGNSFGTPVSVILTKYVGIR